MIAEIFILWFFGMREEWKRCTLSEWRSKIALNIFLRIINGIDSIVYNRITHPTCIPVTMYTMLRTKSLFPLRALNWLMLALKPLGFSFLNFNFTFLVTFYMEKRRKTHHTDMMCIHQFRPILFMSSLFGTGWFFAEISIIWVFPRSKVNYYSWKQRKHLLHSWSNWLP